MAAAKENYQVDFDADKVYYWGISGGTITYINDNSITIQWPNEIGTYVISAYTTRFGCEGDTSYYEVKIEDYLVHFLKFASCVIPQLEFDKTTI